MPHVVLMRPMLISIMATRLFLVSGAACTSNAGSHVMGGDSSDVPVELTKVLVRSGLVGEPVISAQGGVGEILLEGELSTSTPCFEIKGRARLVGHELTVDIMASQRPHEPCAGMVAWFRYQARLGKLTPGSYRVRVLHEGTIPEATRPVFDADVVVR